MKITKTQLRRIIREEKLKLNEQGMAEFLDEITEIWSLLPKKAFWSVLKKAFRNPMQVISLGKHYVQERNWQSLAEYLQRKIDILRDPSQLDRMNEEELVHFFLNYIDNNSDEIIAHIVDHYNQNTGSDLKLESVLTDSMLVEYKKRKLKAINEYGTYSQRAIHRGRYPSTGPDYGGNLTLDHVRQVFPRKSSGEQVDIHDEFGESTNNAEELMQAYVKKYGSLHEGKKMKITKSKLRKLIMEEVSAIVSEPTNSLPLTQDEENILDDVETVPDAWAGGDNLVDPIDWAEVETGDKPEEDPTILVVTLEGLRNIVRESLNIRNFKK